MNIKSHNMETERKSEFKRNNELENLLKDLNSDLWFSEKQLFSKDLIPQLPVILIMGPLRSGTTLFMQWLASTGIVSYPTNLLSRFYGAPILGAKIQLLLTDPRFNFRNELGEFARQVDFASENGKTKGVLAPNEFWYFWRRFLSKPAHDVWTDEELRSSFDSKTMLAELAGIMDVFGKPFAAKGMLFNYNIGYLNEILKKVIFVQIRRDPIANVQSVLLARERQLGGRKKWYSFDIPEYEELKDLDPVLQAAGQVACINRAVEQGLAAVTVERKIIVQYEQFCEKPESVFNDLAEKLNIQGYAVNTPYTGAGKFSPTGHVFLTPDEITAALHIYHKILPA
jgi:hypothetical protein